MNSSRNKRGRYSSVSLAIGAALVCRCHLPCTAGAGASEAYGGAAAWKYERDITIDTTAAGANVSGDVEKYPLAVLLTAQNFDFGQARPRGEDIRFFDADGRPLVYAVEDWDRAAQSAAVWVHLPLVKGNARQSIQMRWGNPQAPSAADSAEVFNEENGYLAVYHLNEEGNTEDGGYLDSSWNEAHGTGQRLEPGSRVEGRIGKATRFLNPNGGEGSSRWIRVGGEKVTNEFNFSESRPITASAWAWGDSFDGYYETIISKGDRSWTLQRDWDKRIEACTLVSAQPRNYHSCAIAPKTNHPPVPKVWNHYMMTARPGRIALYVNGRLAGTSGGNTLFGAHDFAIANQSQYPNQKRGWDGIIDEVRVMADEKDENWAALDFETQRAGQKTVLHGPVRQR